VIKDRAVCLERALACAYHRSCREQQQVTGRYSEREWSKLCGPVVLCALSSECGPWQRQGNWILWFDYRGL